MSRDGLSTRDWTHRDMLRSTAAMIEGRWPDRYGDLIGRLEAVARQIELAGRRVCELPHHSIEEEDGCERRQGACPGFPDACPNLRNVLPTPGGLGGGVRCGCAEEPSAARVPAVCEGFQWIGQSFTTCDRCGQPAWEHAGEDIGAKGAGPFSSERLVRPWGPGVADAIRAKWEGS